MITGKKDNASHYQLLIIHIFFSLKKVDSTQQKYSLQQNISTKKQLNKAKNQHNKALDERITHSGLFLSEQIFQTFIN